MSFLIIAGLGLCVGLGLMHLINQMKLPKLQEHTQQEATVVLEQIREVYKLVVIEGEFADIVQHSSYYGFDLPGFRKKALVRVKAKVSVGYDLDSLRLDFDEATKTIYIDQLPEPEIMSIDTDLSYYDLQESVFNYFEPAELTQLNKSAKDTIRNVALRSDLIPRARQQADKMLQMITQIAQQTGWKVVFSQSAQNVTQELPNSSQSLQKKP